MRDIFFVGFGEAAQALAKGLQPADLRISAYDLKLDNAADGGPCLQAMSQLDTAPCALGDLGQSQVVICLVTADQALVAARAAAPHLAPGALWFDGNSCSPGTKQEAAAVIAAAGGRYVDLALMAPVYPLLHRTPMLASGPDAVAGVAALAALGMQVSVAGDRVGQASSIKMLRSVIIKGLEALTAESFLAARAAGVEDAVIASLQASDPGIDWARRGAYNLERMLVHGARRAAEMQEVATTLRELGLPDRMAQATVAWQAELAALTLNPGPEDLAARADVILRALG
ncbi:MAG: 3-hydroxyisobutyrate dehydrogenase [Rhodobacter sp.]|nr:3-hydroxyisobutyrate dehydrogenase [Rhodobacter sp.]